MEFDSMVSIFNFKFQFGFWLGLNVINCIHESGKYKNSFQKNKKCNK